MSRKTRRNQPTPKPAPQPQARSSPMSRVNIFVAAATSLLIVFIGAALYYKSEKAEATQLTVSRNLPALSSDGSPVLGDPGAKVHIVEFFDPACETCAVFFPYVKEMMSANPGKIRVSLRHVPFHKGSDDAVRILEASRSQGKYLPTLAALYAQQDEWVIHHEVHADRLWHSIGRVGLDLDRLRKDMKAPEIALRMDRDMADARVLGVTKTPEFFVNGRPMPRFGLEELQGLVREELRNAYPG
jgi:protein-disulfide isomerase